MILFGHLKRGMHQWAHVPGELVQRERAISLGVD